MAEVIKTAVLGDADLFNLLEQFKQGTNALEAPGADLLDEIVKRAILVKVRVVEQDPEEHGLRMILNFGHTIGHGIESASEYHLSHGDSVSLGMVAATLIAVRLGWCEPATKGRLIDLLRRFGLPVTLSNQETLSSLNVETIMAAMRADKKRHQGTWRFVLPRSIGVVDITNDVHDNLIIWAIQQLSM
jgi:3-dehydroquinate synthetase